jgi:hypothetical protein
MEAPNMDTGVYVHGMHGDNGEVQREQGRKAFYVLPSWFMLLNYLDRQYYPGRLRYFSPIWSI